MASDRASVDPSRHADEIFDLYSIPAYDNGQPEVVIGNKIGSAKQAVQARDVLLSRIVPHIRRAWVVVEQRGRRQIASGEWIVFRSEAFHPGYLRYLFMSDRFHLHFMNTVAGVGGSLLRARPATVAEIEIRLPELSEQERIAAILERADRLRRLRRYALESGDYYLPAVFDFFFGDSEKNKRRWSRVELTELIQEGDKINYGVVQPGFDLKKGVAIVRVADLENLSESIRFLIRVDPEIDEKHSASRLHGDELLVACVGSIGRVAKAFPKLKGCNIARAVARIPCDWTKINRNFLAHYLTTTPVQEFFTKETRTVSQPTLNVLQIAETPVIMPPLELQERFANLVQRFERLRAIHREALRQADHLFQTLLHRAFTTGW